jgi:hypothetical protein
MGRGPTLTHLAWLVPLTAIIIALRKPTEDNSYLWHIESGLRQLDLGRVLTADPFTFTAGGEAWRTQSWLIELLYGWFEGLAPLASADVVVGVSAVILLGSVGLVVGRRRGVMGPVAVVWVMWLTLGYFTARPVFASLALFALLTLAVHRGRARWAIPALFWVWASIHGGFVVGLGYLVLEALRRRDRRFAVDAVAGAVAATFTAHGLGVWAILASFAGSSQNLDLISEWGAPDFVSIAHGPFLLAIVALVVMGAAGLVRTRDLWVIVPFLVFAFTANRAVPLAAIALAPYVFPENRLQVGRSALARPVAGAVALLVVALPAAVPIESDLFETRFPVEAAREMEPVRTFHDDSAGGYLIYAGFPHVFIDDRAELFGEVYEEFVEARAGVPGWEELFERYGLEQALVKPEDPLRSMLELSGWEQTYGDEEFVVLHR